MYVANWSSFGEKRRSMLRIQSKLGNLSRCVEETGGLTGLTAAYYLGHAKPEWTITLYEQAPRFGGKIQTQRVDDFVVELGPDSYLGRKTEMTDLVHDLGLGDTLVSNETGQAFVYDKGSIHPIPGLSLIHI